MLSTIQYEYGAPVHGRHARRFLFVVSHMRSFSSLLCHILGSHHEISGYAEAHLSYFGRLDLQRLARKVQAATGNAVLGKYVLDKILHNHCQIAPDVLDRQEMKVLFLLRNPEDTFRSLLNLNRIRGAKGRFGDPAQVLEYYVKRLQQLEGYSARLVGKAFFLESERLLADTGQVLLELAQWLGLQGALKTDYRTFPFTGAPGYGDPSPSIMSGRVVRSDEDRHRHYDAVPIPADFLRQGVEAHTACRSGLAKHLATERMSRAAESAD